MSNKERQTTSGVPSKEDVEEFLWKWGKRLALVAVGLLGLNILLK